MVKPRIDLAPLLAAAILCSCSASPISDVARAQPSSDPPRETPVPERRPDLVAGYLGEDLPESLQLLPPPPTENSAAFENDRAVSRASQRLRGTARYAQATADADLSFPHAASAFACALGIPITQQGSPSLYRLLQRTRTDAALATYGAKDHYKRTRPFVYYGEGTCAPADEARLRDDGSYPSGHTSTGWTWALVLTELAPDRADALLARGRSFGDSRLVCNAHWQSDVLEGRAVAAGTVAKLHGNAAFKTDLAAAAAEVGALRQSGQAPNVDCNAEAAALSIRIDGVL